MKPNKKFAKVFRDAALLYLYNGHGPYLFPEENFSCFAIDRSTGTHLSCSRQIQVYTKYFGPPGNLPYNWFPDQNYSSVQSRQEHRCLCLLMMAAMLENP